MKQLVTLISFLSIFFACSNHSQQNAKGTFVRTYFQRSPEATLQDIYKGSFQDVFGPAHILTNKEAVTKYIEYEMNTVERYENEDYVPCGWQGNFYQVNLKVIADGRVPMNDFVDAFMASANGIDTTLTPTFINDWQQIQEAVRKEIPNLKGYAKDSILLAQLLKEGKYVVHHSETFNTHYHPHYRIIRKDIFEKQILPKLKQ